LERLSGKNSAASFELTSLFTVYLWSHLFSCPEEDGPWIKKIVSTPIGSIAVVVVMSVDFSTAKTITSIPAVTSLWG